MNIALWIVQGLLAVVYLSVGTVKAFFYESAKARTNWVRDVPRPLVTFIGVAEMLGGIGLILPWLTGVLPWLTPLAAAGLAVDMLLASGFHLTRREYRAMGGTIVLLVLAALVAYGRFALAA